MSNLISVVMLTWNNYEKFKRCIHSMFFLMLDERVKEIIILDNGSHEIALLDFLKKINKECRKIRVIFNDTNLGVAGGRDVLFREAKGEHIFSCDSDVNIINHELLIDIYLNFIEDPQHYLLGGGGGNHPFFPSIDLKNVVNLASSEKTNEIVFVDEVAGWFQAFRSNILTHNGGKIYMDTQFHPFWGEDSDFCYQIKVLGKKCGIIGRGAIAHAWSSCNKEEVRKTVYPMWNKLIDKWYPQFGDTFKFPYDHKFYNKFYNEEGLIQDEKLRDNYYNNGMLKGEICNKRQILDLYEDADIEGENVLYGDKKLKLTQFVDDYLTYDKIIQKHFHVIEDKISVSEGKGVYIFTAFPLTADENNENKTLEILKKLTGNNIIFICSDTNIYRESIKYIKENFNNYHLSTFYNYRNYDIPFMVVLREIFSKREKIFKNFFKLHPRINIDSKLFSYDLDNLNNLIIPIEGLMDNNDIDEELKNRFNYVGIEYLITPRKDYKFSKGGCFLNYYKYYEEVIWSKQFSDSLDNALKIPFNYNNMVNTRSSPHHLLRKYLSYIPHIKKYEKMLVVIPYSVDIDDDISEINRIVKLFKIGEEGERKKNREDVEVLLVNYGSMKNVNISKTGADYYFMIQNLDNKYPIIANIPGMIENYKEYNNIVFYFGDDTLKGDISDFLEYAKTTNISISKEDNRINLKLFSIIESYYDDLFGFFGSVMNKYREVGGKMDLNATIEANIANIFRMRFLWNLERRKEENEDGEEEVSIIYWKVKERKDSEDEYPFELE